MMTVKGLSGRARLIGAGLVVLAFLVGALAGAAVERVASARPAADKELRRGDPHGGEAYYERLDLSEEQSARVDEILERRRAHMAELWQDFRPRLNAVVDSARGEIREVLTPEQREEEERVWAERRLRLKFDARGGARRGGEK